MVHEDVVERALFGNEPYAELASKRFDEGWTGRLRRQIHSGRILRQVFDEPVELSLLTSLVDHRPSQASQTGKGGYDLRHGDVA